MKNSFLYYLKTRRYYWYTPGVSMLAGCSLWDFLAPNDQQGLDLEILDQYLTDEGMDMTLSPELAKLAEPGIDLDAELVTILGQHPTQELQQDRELGLGVIDLAPLFHHNIQSNNFAIYPTELERKKAIVNQYANEPLDTRLAQVNQDLAKEGIPTFQHKAALCHFIGYYNPRSKSSAELKRKKAIVSQYINELPDTRLAQVNQALTKERIPTFKNNKALRIFIKYHNHLLLYPTELERKKEIVNQYANEPLDTRLAQVNQDLAKERIPTFKNNKALRIFIKYHNIRPNYLLLHPTERKKAIVNQYANELLDTRLAQVNQALAKEKIPIFKNNKALRIFIKYHNIRPNYLLLRPIELERKKEIVSQYINASPDTRLAQVNQALAQERIPTFKNKEALRNFTSYHTIRLNHLPPHSTELEIKKAIINEYANALPDTRLTQANPDLTQEATPTFQDKHLLYDLINDHNLSSNHAVIRHKKLERKKTIVSQYTNEKTETRLAQVNQALTQEGISIFKNKETLRSFIRYHKIRPNHLLLRSTELERKKIIVSQHPNARLDTRLAKINQALAKERIPTFKNKETLRNFIFYHKIRPNHLPPRSTELERKKAIVSQYANSLPDTRLTQVNQGLTQEAIPTFKDKHLLHAFINYHNLSPNHACHKKLERKKAIIRQYANELPDARLAQVNQALAKEEIPTFKNKKTLSRFIFRHKIQLTYLIHSNRKKQSSTSMPMRKLTVS